MQTAARIVLLAGALALTGCGKKEAKLPPESKANPGDTPNFGSKSGPPGGIQPSGGAGGGGAFVPAGGVGVVVNPAGAVGGGGGGGGAAQAVRKAVKRTATNNELTQIRLFIENASAVDGKIPPPELTFAALQKEAPKIAEAITEGVIVLWRAKTRDEIWAYEAAAVENGGQVVTSSGIERMDAATLKQRLGMK
jgi:hypothetical protein